MLILLTALFFVLGAAFGSFACCQLWRIKKHDKSTWSHCMNCNYRLQWYDNIPIISWLSLGGKCRKCKKPIGVMELLSELGMGLCFALVFLFWPWRDLVIAGNLLEMILIGVFLLLLTALGVAFLYDAKWKELPMVAVLWEGIFALVFFILRNASNNFVELDGTKEIVDLILALLILPGFYFVLYKVSREKWVGGGDYLLCIPLALVLQKFWLSLFCLFAANVLGCIIMVPVVMLSKKKDHKIPFGPFLILGFLLIFLVQANILEFLTF